MSLKGGTTMCHLRHTRPEQGGNSGTGIREQTAGLVKRATRIAGYPFRASAMRNKRTGNSMARFRASPVSPPKSIFWGFPAVQPMQARNTFLRFNEVEITRAADSPVWDRYGFRRRAGLRNPRHFAPGAPAVCSGGPRWPPRDRAGGARPAPSDRPCRR
jgi:hypothetical protein